MSVRLESEQTENVLKETLSMKIDDRVTIIVGSCDAYRDIVEYYLYFLKSNWMECRYRILIAMEEANVDSDIAETIKNGASSTWTERIINTIKHTDSPYILLSVDDLFISKPVVQDDINAVINFIEKEKIKYYRIPTFKTSKRKKMTYPENDNAELIDNDSPYNVSIGSAIWDRNELLGILGEGTMSAWDLENYFLEQASNSCPGYKDKYVSDKRFLLNSVHMIKAGKWIPNAANMIKKLGYEVNFEKRGYVPLKNVIKSNILGIGGRICPKSMRWLVKKTLRNFGIKFATNY